MTRTRSKIRTTGVTIKKNILLFALVLGATAGAVAPFVHIMYPKTAPEKLQLEIDFEKGDIGIDEYRVKKSELKEKYKFLGFTNKRRFMFAIGLPISLFVSSLFLLFSARRINEKKIKKGFAVAGSLFEFTSMYFIVWTIWAYKTGSDFPRYMYYLSIVAIAFSTVIATRILVNGWLDEVSKFRKMRDDVIEFFVEIKEVHYMK